MIKTKLKELERKLGKSISFHFTDQKTYMYIYIYYKTHDVYNNINYILKKKEKYHMQQWIEYPKQKKLQLQQYDFNIKIIYKFFLPNKNKRIVYSRKFQLHAYN